MTKQTLVRIASRGTVVGLVMPLLFTIGCGSQQSGPTAPSTVVVPTPTSGPVTSAPTTGQLSFSSTASKGWTRIAINVDGRAVGALTAYVTDTTASCAANAGRVVIAVAPGTHSYSAQSDTGATWSGTASVPAGGCTETQLTCQNNDCSVQTSGGLVFDGPVSYRTSGTTVAMAISKILNTRSSRTGSLRVDLWASTAPYSGSGVLSGVLTASIRTAQVTGLSDTLAPGAYFSNIQMTLPYTKPTSQYGFYTMVLSEYSSTCPSADHYCLTAYVSMQ